MSWLCWIGLHRWAFKDERDGRHLDTYARCRRAGCTRHHRWFLVNREPFEVYDEPTETRKAA